MPSNGIQVAITGEITPTSISDTYPVLNPYWGLGGLRTVTDLVDRDAITTSRREVGMLVFVASNGHYYKMESGLGNLNWTDLGTSLGGGSGSYALPIVRYVYLVGDVSDATRMGGVTDNVYSTFQTAYDAADILQVALGANSIVVIQVGNTLGSVTSLNVNTTTVGDLTLTANYNPRVRLAGLSSKVSVLGNIIATNVAGNGFNIGTNTNVQWCISNVRIGNITTSATGVTGNSGSITLSADNCSIGNIETTLTNAANTTGNAGAVNINFSTTSGLQLAGSVIITSITTSTSNTVTTAGNVQIRGKETIVGTVTLANNNLGGNSITIADGATVGNVTTNSISSSGAGTTNIIGSTISSLSMNIVGGSVINLTNTNVGALVITNNGLSITQIAATFKNSNISTYDTNLNVRTIATLSVFDNGGFGIFTRPLIANIGNNSIFNQCSFISTNLQGDVISNIGSNSKIIGCNFIINVGGSYESPYSISNSGTPVSITSKNNTFAKGSSLLNITSEITLVENELTYLTASVEGASGTLEINAINDEYTTIYLDNNIILQVNIPNVGKNNRILVDTIGVATPQYIDFNSIGVFAYVENSSSSIYYFDINSVHLVDYYFDGNGNMFVKITRVGSNNSALSVVDITYADLATLKANITLARGITYRIIDRDLGIYIQALDYDKLDFNVKRVMLVANHVIYIGGVLEPDPVVAENSQGKVWTPYPIGGSYSVGDVVAWGGRIWMNMTGSIGNADSDLILNATDWIEQPFVEGEDYIRMTFDCTYDFDTELFITQKDKNNNIVGPVTQNDVNTLSYNPCDITDWSAFNYTYTGYDNVSRLGFVNNAALINRGSMYRNTLESLVNNIISDDGNGYAIVSNRDCGITNNIGIRSCVNNIYTDITNNVIDDPNTSIIEYIANEHCSFLYNTRVTSFNNNYKCSFEGNVDIINMNNNKNCIFSNNTDLRTFESNEYVSGDTTTYSPTKSISYVKSFGEGIYFFLNDELNFTTFDRSGNIFMYIEFKGPFPLNTPVYKGQFPAIWSNPYCRINEAVITGLSLTANANIEFGIETSAVAYMPPILASTLLSTPQKITTISGPSNINTGHKFYVKATVNASPGATGRIRVWLKLIVGEINIFV